MRYKIFASSGLLIAGAALAVPAAAQPTYSIDFQGPTIGMVTEGDVLTPIPPGNPPPPAVVFPFGALGIVPTPPPGFVELDALSYGLDQVADPALPHQWQFSVDEFAVGAPGVPAPSVTTVGAGSPAMEASADVFATNTGAGPLGPGAPPGANVGMLDGDNLAIAYGTIGLNLAEPNPPTPMAIPDGGDNLDACDVDQPPAYPVYFSLDSFFFDPLEGAPANTGTAMANGFVGGDVLVTFGGAPAVYAPAALLGLDADGAAPDSDDLDGLILFDNGDGMYQPVTGPYSWMGGGTDMLLYSVRRDSAVIGMIDVLLGLPIEEGDILIAVYDPLDGVPMFDGNDGDWDVGIFIAAEVLGLATVRSGTAVPWGIINPKYGADIWADEVDALDFQAYGAC